MRRIPFNSRKKHIQRPIRVEKPQPIPQPLIPAILVSRNSGGLGDILMITPTVRAIKEQNPNIPLIFCTTSGYGRGGILFEAIKYNPYIDKAISVNDLSKYSFQKVYNFNTGKEIEMEVNPNHPTLGNRIDIFAELAGVELKDKTPIYTVIEEEKVWAKKWIKDNVKPGREKIICIQAKTTASKRDWPEEKILLLAFTLVNTLEDVSILLFYDGFIEKSLTSYPNIYPIIGMPIRQVAALFNESEAVVVPDSGLLHIAGALRKKGVGIFGSIRPESRLKYYPNIVPAYLNFSCSPCWYDKCDRRFSCITDISVDEIYIKLCKLMGRLAPAKKGILVYRMGGIGDLIMLSPALKELKNSNPDGKLTLATKAEHIGVLKGLPYIDDVVDMRGVDPEIVADSRIMDLRYKVECPEVGGSLNTLLYKTVNRVDMFAQLLSVELKSRECNVFLNPEEIEKMKMEIGMCTPTTGDAPVKWLGIQVTCTSNVRTIPPEYIPELILKFLQVKNLKVVLLGRLEWWKGRKVIVDFRAIEGENIINMMDRSTKVSELTALISLMDYIVSPDSASVHIAGALKKPCLALFGNMLPSLRIDQYPTVQVLYPEGRLECIPCWDFINPCLYYNNIRTIDQPIGGECMRLLNPDAIFEKSKELFKLEV